MFSSTKRLTAVGLFIALIAVGTLAIRIPVPATNGYIHLGDSMIYLISILFGPYIGMIASGLGSAMADILGGYSHWALPTLIIKGLEGLIIGYLTVRDSKRPISIRNTAGLLIGGIWMVFGYYLGGVALRGGWVIPLDSIPWNIIQALGGAVLALPVIYALGKTKSFQNWIKDFYKD